MAPIFNNFNSDHNYRINFDKDNTIAKHGENESKQFSPKQLVKKFMNERIAQIDTDICGPGEEDAFYVADLGEVYRQHLRWKANLPGVKPFFAVKCNPDEEVIKLLAKLGTGFDCASKAEIDLVLGLGVDPSRIIYAQPCKTKSYLRHAAQVGVKTMTFDNADELLKIKQCFPEAQIVLRILTDDSASLCRLSTKFGADLVMAHQLVQLAKQLGLNLVGVSFHVGSGASDPSAFHKAVSDARKVFDWAADIGFDMTLLDVGGGFTTETFETFASALNEALVQHFPHNVRIIAEPGRFYTADAFTLTANVIARRDVRSFDNKDESYMLYLNDGVYGNFSNIIFDHQHPVPQVLYSSNSTTSSMTGSTDSLLSVDSYASRDARMREYSIWGPTCDGIDVITGSVMLPGKLEVGDWLYFESMGAYTKCSATKFNGFTDRHETIYVSSETGASALLGYRGYAKDDYKY